jgi:hypothetical protein
MSELLREPDDTVFGRGIRDPATARHLPRDGGDIDDDPTISLKQVCECFPCQQVHANQVHVENPLPELRRCLLERLAVVDDTRVVDERIDAALLVGSSAHHS